MTASSFAKTPARTGYSTGDNGWRRSLENGGRGGRLMDKRTAELVKQFSKGDTVDHNYDDRLKGGIVTRVDACKVYVLWPGYIRDSHYHPSVLTVTKKMSGAAASADERPKQHAKKK